VEVCREIPDVLIIDSWLTVPEFLEKYSTIEENSTAEVIVDCFCGAAILRGSHLFAPGVLALQKGNKKLYFQVGGLFS